MRYRSGSYFNTLIEYTMNITYNMHHMHRQKCKRVRSPRAVFFRNSQVVSTKLISPENASSIDTVFSNLFIFTP